MKRLNVRQKTVLWKILGIILVFIVIKGQEIANGFGSYTSSSVHSFFPYKVFDYNEVWKQKSLVLAMEQIVFVVYFNLMFGSYISSCFDKGSIFLFSRIENRRRWFWNKSMELFIITGMEVMLYLLLCLGLTMYQCAALPTIECIGDFILLWISCMTILFISTLFINVLGIKFGTNIGFFITYIGMIVLMQLSLQYNMLPVIGAFEKGIVFIPVSVVTLLFYEDIVLTVIAVLWYIGISGIIIAIAANYVKNMDISLKKNIE